MIKSITIDGLNGGPRRHYRFHRDINVLTGRNGSGKTTVLKMIWYLISGNLELLIPEITFTRAEIRATRYSVCVELLPPVDGAARPPATEHSRSLVTRQHRRRRPVRVTWRVGRLPQENEDLDVTDFDRITPPVMHINQAIATATGSSVFFPTFRRFEGGFSVAREPHAPWMAEHPGRMLQQVLTGLSQVLSVENHVFVSSISTMDIVALINREYARASETTNKKQGELARYIIGAIDKYSAKAEKSSPANDESQSRLATEILGRIKDRVRSTVESSDASLRPFATLSRTVSECFSDKSILVGDTIRLGQLERVIASDRLSAGEKQLLSFLAYNTFVSRAPIFIDEPEISLHPDWQRRLFPILLEQNKTNQFFVATHSPFIYGKFADKEICLDRDRGE